jgi:hypothetical protein
MFTKIPEINEKRNLIASWFGKESIELDMQFLGSRDGYTLRDFYR